ncbi:hypothetical protein WDU94_013995 [Cyamophila willieti]
MCMLLCLYERHTGKKSAPAQDQKRAAPAAPAQVQKKAVTATPAQAQTKAATADQPVAKKGEPAAANPAQPAKFQQGAITCDICSIKFSSVVDFERHIKSKGHKKQQGAITCDICSIKFSSVVDFERHIKSKGHKKQLRNVTLEAASEHSVSTSSSPDCLTRCNNLHIKSKGHKKQLRNVTLEAASEHSVSTSSSPDCLTKDGKDMCCLTQFLLDPFYHTVSGQTFNPEAQQAVAINLVKVKVKGDTFEIGMFLLKNFMQTVVYIEVS